MFSPDATTLLAYAVLGTFAGVLIVIGIFLNQTSRLTPFRALIYVYGYLTARLIWRAETNNFFPDIGSGGAILVCNHRCPFDPMMMQLVAPRLVRWMVAREYCESTGLKWYFKLSKSIPVSRSGIDTKSTRSAIRAAQEGDLVGLFPEGRINTTDEVLLPGRPGIAMIAINARVPVVPCYIFDAPIAPSMGGTLFTPSKTRLVVGKPIDLSAYYDHAKERDAHKQVTLLLLRAIAELAGEIDYQPRLAGRRWNLPSENNTADNNSDSNSSDSNNSDSNNRDASSSS